MTYCVGMCLNAGLVMMSDSRTKAGVDNISTFGKMTVCAAKGIAKGPGKGTTKPTTKRRGARR